MMDPLLPLNLLVEGSLDEVVGRRLADECGFSVGNVYGRNGWQSVQRLAPGLAASAAYAPCLGLVDLIGPSEDCPPSLVSAWISHPHPHMLLRVVVREVESWLLADRTGIAQFFGVSLSRVPQLPEGMESPKEALIRVARFCPTGNIRDAIVPSDGPQAEVGPLYNGVLAPFVRDQWNLHEARRTAPSLERALDRLSELAARLRSA